MEIIEGYTLLPNNKFWIYTLNKDMYDLLEEVYINDDTEHYLPLYQHYNMKQFDIVFFWVKKKNTMYGLIGMCQLYSGPKYNQKLIINKDFNIQRYIAECDTVSLLKDKMNKDKFEQYMTNNELYSSYASFSRKYIKKEGSLQEIPLTLGLNILEYFSQEEINNKKNKIEEIHERNSVFSKIRSKPKSFNIFDNMSTPEINSDDIEKDSDFISDSSDNFSDDSSDLSDNMSDSIGEDSDSQGEREEEKEDPEHIDGYIPIMIIPCNDYKLPNDKFYIQKNNQEEIDEYGNTPVIRKICDYFINHIYQCRKCEVTNNNRVELNILLKDCNVSYIQCKENSAEMQLIFDKYFTIKKCNLFGDTIEKTTMKLVFLYDKYSHYNNCLYICIADPPSQNQDDTLKLSPITNISDSDSSDSSDSNNINSESSRNIFE
jgi:hypothetical protein